MSYDYDIAAHLQRAIDDPPEDWSSWYELVKDALDEITRLRENEHKNSRTC